MRVSLRRAHTREFREAFWVDTGALYTFAPEDRLKAIGIVPKFPRDFVSADGNALPASRHVRAPPRRRPVPPAADPLPRGRLGRTLTAGGLADRGRLVYAAGEVPSRSRGARP